jgi:predicted outer membrane repeat protein
MQKFTVAISILFLTSVSLHAATIHVPADQPTIQAGIDAASAGDTVLVECETYYEHDIMLKDGIVLVSTTGFQDCVTIDALQQGTVFNCSGIDLTIQGFTITGGQVALNGGGMNIYDSSVALVNCRFVGNECTDWEWSRGGAIYCEDASPSFLNCEFVENTCGAAGAIYCKFGAPTFTNCTFSRNLASGGGAVIGRSSSPTFTGCSFLENTATTWGGAIHFSFPSTPTLTNCTFYGNTADDAVGGGAIYCQESMVTVEYCIFWGDSPEEIILDMGGTATALCSDIQGGWPGEGNIDLDPLFCDPNMGDFTLRNDSPCAPENNDCGLMGAWPVGCSTGTENATWSQVKALY